MFEEYIFSLIDWLTIFIFLLPSFQMTDLSGRSADRVFNRSAAVLAALGIALSSFSLKQMVSTNNSRRN